MNEAGISRAAEGIASPGRYRVLKRVLCWFAGHDWGAYGCRYCGRGRIRLLKRFR